ncbi:hypothetical protein N7532_008601 [Penicillium argentinense]|uniref:Uncharacterized protein n=1 Tax=Penicillium argentinense TaxID=1131581 RepID=A0A9W9EXQ7_9EURO|nr:uncharacterized protein N7532_008601 [Penicillium argentinense]KAJ5089917.1 hypothetical protein N7532_008601 [Penicillium argentinense]
MLTFARLSSRVLTSFRVSQSTVPRASARSFTMASDPSTYKLNRLSPRVAYFCRICPPPVLKTDNNGI